MKRHLLFHLAALLVFATTAPSGARGDLRSTATFGIQSPVAAVRCGQELTVRVSLDDVTAMRGYNIRFQINNSHWTPPPVVTDLIPEYSGTIMITPIGGPGTGKWEVAYTILGETDGFSTSIPVDVFQISLAAREGAETCDSAIQLLTEQLKLRDINNVLLDVGLRVGEESVSIDIDCTAPTVTGLSAPTCWTDPTPEVTATGTESPACGNPVTKLYYQYKTPAGTPCSNADWTLLGTVALTDSAWTYNFNPPAPPDPGEYTLYISAEDLAGNQGLCANAGSVDLSYETVAPPSSVTNLRAEAGHRKVTLTWTIPTLGLNDEIAVVRVRAGGYPLYGDDVAYPANSGVGTLVYVGTGTSHLDQWGTGDQPESERDIYLYRAFVRNCAGETSVGRTTLFQDFTTEVTTDATDAAANYWLGDINNAGGSFNGTVNGTDLVTFSGNFGEDVPPGYAGADYAPTVMPPYGAKGVPDPDGRIDFEDLIVLAINYNTVGPRQGPAPIFADTDEPFVLSGRVDLEVAPLTARSIRAGQIVTAEIRLAGEVGDVSGIRTLFVYDPGILAIESVEVSDRVRSLPHFFKDLPRGGRVDLNLAMFGEESALEGAGTVFHVRLRGLRGGPLTLRLAESSVRDPWNRELLTGAPESAAPRTERAVSLAAVPKEFRLGDARPNPFNPRTTIFFEIPAPVAVRLAVYDVAGRQVRTLTDREWAAGSHSVEWDGADDLGRPLGSGIYFYEMKGDSYVSQKRMTLLK